jgi:DNA-directed RNA polymerase subunit M/transcription elongation factor TFIIS
MLKLKSELTCWYCSKIFKDPFDLPCGDSMCREHLTDRDVVKVNKIKCKKCNQEFQVKNNDFKSNQTLKKLVEDQTHLSDEEINQMN